MELSAVVEELSAELSMSKKYIQLKAKYKIIQQYIILWITMMIISHNVII